VATAQQQSEVNSLNAPSQVERYSLSTAQLPKSALPITSSGDKVIFHVDFDCFFVSCGLATRPHLRGKPSVVCHSQTGKNASTSEIASASYEARDKGVKNGMSLGRARQLVGDTLQTIPYVPFSGQWENGVTDGQLRIRYIQEIFVIVLHGLDGVCG
jgi:DNA repair protein REV1